MVLDWSLMRVLLAHVEQETFCSFLKDAEKANRWKEGQTLTEKKKTKDPALREIHLHLELLINGGYLLGVTMRESADGQFMVSPHNPRLTLEGYSLLESLRTDGFIDKLKEYAGEHGTPLTINLIGSIAQAFVQSLLK